MTPEERERRECLRRGWGIVENEGWIARAGWPSLSPESAERQLRDVLWRLMVGSHSK